MEIESDINKKNIFKLLDKHYNKIIFKSNDVSSYDYYTSLNRYYNFSLKHNKQQMELFKNAIKLNKNCNEILIYNYKSIILQPDFMEFILYLLSKCKNIITLSINNSSLCDYNNNQYCIINDLTKILKIPSLKKISLANNNLNNVNPIFKLLKENKTLEILNLSFNRISDISILMDVLQYNNTIKIIDLSNNYINNFKLNNDLIKRYPNINFIF